MNWAVCGLLIVTSSASARAVDFDTELIPVLTKAGCNSGACHGAAAGRAGFHLSLLGADPTEDYQAVALALEGRRINHARPEMSLLLAKPTGQLEHGGEVVLDEDGAGALRILTWIREGAQRGSTRQLTSLTVTPQRQIVRELPARVPLHVTAHFDQGPAEDVTAWTLFMSTDPAAVTLSDEQVATIQRRGQHIVIARFLNRVVPIQFNVPLSDVAIDHSQESRTNLIDAEILDVLADLQLPVSPLATDEAFFRRVTLDLTGRLPDPAHVATFLQDSAVDKRDRWVATLLSSDAFADYWTLRFARLLKIHSLPNDQAGLRAYVQWLRQVIADDVPLNQVAQQLLTATGDTHIVGPANFARMVPDARGHAELVGEVFLGVRLGCANCHNHPLDRWTQDDYHGLAAVFARLDRGREVGLTSRGAVTNLRTNEPAIPRIPGQRYLAVEGDQRQAVADWLTASDDLSFARATVNRLWQAMMGRGLVEPVDDLRETNPPTHPQLLDRLAADFVAHNYRIRHTLRLIALSQTYGRSSRAVAGNGVDDRFYSHAYHRPLEPEVLADAIADVTGVANTFPGQPAGTRAVAIVDPLTPAPALDVLGRCTRLNDCAASGSDLSQLPAQLHLLNGELINHKLTDDAGRLRQLLAAGHSNEQLIEEFYVRALSRPPTSGERAAWCDRLASEDADERRQRLEDFVWSLLNSRQFRENH